MADMEDRRVKAIANARPSVVSLRTYRQSGGEPGIGSGVIIRGDGIILTNFHVIDGAEIIKVKTTDGREFVAQLFHMAPQHDLALLKIHATGLRPAKIGSSKSVKLGQTAIAIGDPLGFESSVTIGTVGGLKRSVEVNNVNYTALIQTDAAINPGSSGGALVDLDGRVVGINTLVYTGPRSYKHAQGLGFAIAIDHAMMVAKALMQRTPEAVSSRPWLGIKADTITRDLSEAYGLGAKKGVFVRKVFEASPAAVGGVKNGDIILRVDGTPLLGLTDLADYISGKRPGDVIQFELKRDSKIMKVDVKLDVSSR